MIISDKKKKISILAVLRVISFADQFWKGWAEAL